MEDTASTHIMAADETGTWDNLTVSVNYPSDAMLAFMLPASTTYQTRPSDVKDYDVKDFWPQINTNIAQIIFEMVQVESARMREEVGLVSPRPSTTETPSAPKAPDRPPILAVAQDPGQQLATAVRTLVFSAVPAGVPDA